MNIMTRDLAKDLKAVINLRAKADAFVADMNERWAGAEIESTHIPKAWGKGCICVIDRFYIDYNGGNWLLFMALYPLYSSYTGNAGPQPRNPELADVGICCIRAEHMTTIYEE